MTITVNEKTRELFPASVRRQAGFKMGDTPEVSVNGVYTPAQRRAIDARLAKAAEDVTAGRVHGPFDSWNDFERSLRATGKQPRRKA